MISFCVLNPKVELRAETTRACEGICKLLMKRHCYANLFLSSNGGPIQALAHMEKGRFHFTRVRSTR